MFAIWLWCALVYVGFGVGVLWGGVGPFGLGFRSVLFAVWFVLVVDGLRLVALVVFSWLRLRLVLLIWACDACYFSWVVLGCVFCMDCGVVDCGMPWVCLHV